MGRLPKRRAYQVYAINPLSAARYRERHATSGAKSDAGDAHVLAEIVRLDREHHRPVAGDSELPDAVKLLARAHRSQHVDAKAVALQEILRAPALRQPPTVEGAYATIVASEVRIIAALNAQITGLAEVMDEHFDRHPAAEIYLSQPGLGVVLASRVMGEFGDDKTRFADARARKNYSEQSPITRASGRKKVVLARYATNRRLGAALHMQAYAALTGSRGARAYYDQLRSRGIGHHAALRQLANRLVGILHGCLETGTLYDENTAWQHHQPGTTDIAA